MSAVEADSHKLVMEDPGTSVVFGLNTSLVDARLTGIAKLAGYSIGGTMKRGRGYRVILWHGSVGNIHQTLVARKKLHKFLAKKVAKLGL